MGLTNDKTTENATFSHHFSPERFSDSIGNRAIGPIQTVASNLTRLRLSITCKSQNRAAVFFGKNESSSSKKTHNIIVCMYTCTHTRQITPHTTLKHTHTVNMCIPLYGDRDTHTRTLTLTEAQGAEGDAERERHVFIYTYTPY